MDFLTDWLTDWLKELLIGGIMGNLEGLFDYVNTQVGEIAVQVGTTPAAWNAGVFSLIRQLSETVILPIAGLVLTFVATYELIQMLLEKNNMHEFDVANIYKWMFKTACAIFILSNTFDIVMAVFDVSQTVIAQAGGLIQGSTDITPDMITELETTLEGMDLGPLLGLWLQSSIIGVTMWALGIVIFVLVYSGMEAELQNYLDTYTATHSYDEYHFDLDEIEHDPYVLISILCVLHEGEWTADEVQGTLENLFDRQYILTERVVRETRYDSDGDPYSWYICYVTLENKNLSHLPLEMMGEEQMARYSLYMSTLGNRPDLFPESAYVGKYITNPPADYDVPEEYLDDETFAAILGEAEKYLGYPYVWGGSSPATSFDCSGFVSWVINHSGWNVGRLGAQGLYNICTPTSAPRPGDLVFFVGTYDTAGVSHCGIYVGDGMMIHCGDPIQYANLNTSYWQSHFYAYGRLP